jgi:hypothetical protein
VDLTDYVEPITPVDQSVFRNKLEKPTLPKPSSF